VELEAGTQEMDAEEMDAEEQEAEVETIAAKGIAEPEGEVDAVKAETQADESTCEHKTNHSSPVSTPNHSPTLVTITCFLNITCHPKVVGRQTQASFMLPCG